MEITQEIFNEIKNYQEQGKNSKEVSKIFNDRNILLSFVQVNDIFSHNSFDSFNKGKGNVEKVAPAQAGYYRSLIAKKQEENGNLKNQRGWLLEQVYYLRKHVKFLEARKYELEQGIRSMEGVLNIGIGAIEQLEQNENFEELSEQVKNKNR